MVRAMSVLLSFWLGLLFVVSTAARVPKLMVFFVGLAAILALLGALISPIVGAGLRLGGPIALSLGLVAIGGVALAMKLPPWLPFCLFIGTFGFVASTVAEVLWSPRNRGTMAPADS